MALRPDLAVVAKLVPPGSHVLDLGCGDGALLEHLYRRRGCTGTGVENDLAAIQATLKRGVPVLRADLDHDLGHFSDIPAGYDVVVLSRTLQAVLHPTTVLTHMRMIAPLMVVSMPNFGLWRNRARLMTGHMPRSRDLPFTWHDTPNLHHATLVDLEAYFEGLDLVIEQKVTLTGDGRPAPLGTWGSNLLAGSAVYLLRSEGS